MNDERKTSFEDELLDRALEHQRVEEPRPGLEGRILARLETASAPRSNWFFRACAVAVPVVLLAVLAVYLFRPPATQTTVTPEPPRVVEIAPPAVPDPERLSPIPAPPPVVKEEVPVVAVTETAPRSPTFPSRRELSPQEALMVRFVRRTPTETLRAVAQSPPVELQIDELSTPQIQIEPLPAPDPLSAS